jgi:probable F420-dependent oxidoreductase
MSWPERVREVDALGYDTLLMTDHLDGQYAIGPAMGMAAAVSSRLHFGSLVYCNDLYHPVLLAREAATLDQISGGRFQLGLGAGWDTRDYARAGVPFGGGRERIARLAESVQLIRRCLAGEPFSYSGSYYRADADRSPVPILGPTGMPSILIGGGGPRILRVAGELADIAQINPRMRWEGEVVSMFSPDNGEAGTTSKMAWIAEGAGERLGQLELSVIVYAAMVTDDRDRAARYLARRAKADVDQVLGSPHALIGTVGQIVDTLLWRRDRWGLSYIVVDEWYRHTLAAVVEKLADT